MEKKTDFSCCSVIFFVGLALLAIYIIKTISDSFLELLKAAGLCLGVAGILFALFIIISLYNVRLVRKSRDFSLRCYPVELEIPTTLPIPPDLPEAPGQETIHPLFLLANLTNYGMRLAPHPPRPNWKWFPADNATRLTR